jgi:hypothetical protein
MNSIEETDRKYNPPSLRRRAFIGIVGLCASEALLEVLSTNNSAVYEDESYEKVNYETVNDQLSHYEQEIAKVFNDETKIAQSKRRFLIMYRASIEKMEEEIHPPPALNSLQTQEYEKFKSRAAKIKDDIDTNIKKIEAEPLPPIPKNSPPEPYPAFMA